ncbi:MAG: BRCT domain-containing protein [Lentisphaeria bacterium]|jgi:DNA ligase (NAD+)
MQQTWHPLPFWAGKSFCITGTLGRPRQEIVAAIKGRGGLVREAVTKKLDYLIAGEAAGSKLEKARALGVTVLTEAEFAALCAGPAGAAPADFHLAP